MDLAHAFAHKRCDRVADAKATRCDHAPVAPVAGIPVAGLSPCDKSAIAYAARWNRMTTLAQFIRRDRENIVAAWLTQVEQLPSAADKPYAVLRDHVPAILERLATVLERGEGSDPTLNKLAAEHAALRYHAGYDLRQIVLEYQALRQVILKLYQASEPTVTLHPIAAMDRSLDEAIGDAVDRFMGERDKVRDVFISILGHDLRTPLQSLTMAVEMFRTDAEVPARLSKTASSASRAIARMDRMIGDLLDFARGRLGGGIPINPAPADLREVVGSVVDEFTASFLNRAIHCGAATAQGDFVGEWDAARIGQAVSNLVRNAIEHGADPILIALVDHGDTVRVEVSNQGTIVADVLPMLFQPFHRGRDGNGLGLGLFVVDEVARAHGGRIDVDSSPDQGTRFSLVLPRAALAPTRPRGAA